MFKFRPFFPLTHSRFPSIPVAAELQINLVDSTIKHSEAKNSAFHTNPGHFIINPHRTLKVLNFNLTGIKSVIIHLSDPTPISMAIWTEHQWVKISIQLSVPQKHRFDPFTALFYVTPLSHASL